VIVNTTVEIVGNYPRYSPKVDEENIPLHMNRVTQSQRVISEIKGKINQIQNTRSYQNNAVHEFNKEALNEQKKFFLFKEKKPLFQLREFEEFGFVKIPSEAEIILFLDQNSVGTIGELKRATTQICDELLCEEVEKGEVLNADYNHIAWDWRDGWLKSIDTLQKKINTINKKRLHYNDNRSFISFFTQKPERIIIIKPPKVPTSEMIELKLKAESPKTKTELKDIFIKMDKDLLSVYTSDRDYWEFKNLEPALLL